MFVKRIKKENSHLHCYLFSCVGDSTSKVTSASVSNSLTAIFMFIVLYLAMSFCSFNTVSCLFHPECNAAIHKKCIEKIIGRCTGTAANSRETMVSEADVLQHE